MEKRRVKELSILQVGTDTKATIAADKEMDKELFTVATTKFISKETSKMDYLTEKDLLLILRGKK